MLAVETTVPSGTGSGPYIGVIRDRRERSYTVTSAKVSIMCVCGGGGYFSVCVCFVVVIRVVLAYNF